jgi:cellulose synthase/poly-beta-1,6-N-acetylglucosamine synthase-like glycosyltransferase
MPLRHVVVLIPARNEEDLLPRCLYSVLRACTVLPRSINYDIIVSVDSSTDRTREIAENILRGHGTVVVTDAGCVGQARIAAAEAGLERYTGALDTCWLANTDADCCVPENWLLDQLAYADSGMHAVAGVVDVDSFAEHQSEVRELFRRSYVLHADGTHPHVHGANFGVRADAYVKAGGWADLTTAEDHDLWQRLLEAGARRASVARLSVTTSGRRIGRAPDGFAGALAAHNSLIGEAVVEII